MVFQLAHIAEVAHGLWPLAGAESWDAAGLIVGDPNAPVTTVHCAVDAVHDTVEEALSIGAQLLLVHHPLLLRPVTSVAEDTYKGALIARLIRGGCALLAAHTNADVVEEGTSGILAERLGISNLRPIRASLTNPDLGIGRVGELSKSVSLGDLAHNLADILPKTAQGIRVGGDELARVKRVALCAGAGDSLLADPAVRAADVYITSDLRHHPASEFRENTRLSGGPALVDISHWAAESLWLDVAARELRREFPTLLVSVSKVRTDPWDFVILASKSYRREGEINEY